MVKTVYRGNIVNARKFFYFVQSSVLLYTSQLASEYEGSRLTVG